MEEHYISIVLFLISVENIVTIEHQPCHFRMKMLIIHNLWCVGMHHWGSRQLAVGAGYKLCRESNNPKDANAVCVLDGPNKKAYMKREDAQIISKIIDLGLSNNWLLKPKEDAIVKQRRTGPQQRCSIGCKTSSVEIDNATNHLRKHGVFFELKELL